MKIRFKEDRELTGEEDYIKVYKSRVYEVTLINETLKYCDILFKDGREAIGENKELFEKVG